MISNMKLWVFLFNPWKGLMRQKPTHQGHKDRGDG